MMVSNFDTVDGCKISITKRMVETLRINNLSIGTRFLPHLVCRELNGDIYGSDPQVWTLKIQGVGWAPLLVATKPCAKPPATKTHSSSQSHAKSHYQKHAPLRIPHNRQVDFRDLCRGPHGRFC